MSKKPENLSHRISRWVGSPASLIVHTIFFITMLSLRFFGVAVSDVLLILTTVVSLEAIYLSIFIQMTVNQHTIDLEEVSEDIEEISEDVGDIQKDVEGISEDVEDIQKDVEEISEDVEDIQEEIKDEE
ncbi:MAG: hypothetical protein M3P22_01315 [bacterium]|nr:hypothetical protein [bacterium]